MDIFDSIQIASTLHEPEFRLKDVFQRTTAFIKRHIPHIYLSYTSQTSEEVVSALSNEGIICKVTPNDDQVNTYNYAVKLCIDNWKDNISKRIFYIDFDRLLHWINFYPEELIKIIGMVDEYDFLHIGRTARAFETHPKTQKRTEGVINNLGSKVLEEKRIIDIISVNFAFSKRLAKIIIDYSYSTAVGFYCTWPIILWKNANNPSYVEVEGLEWETPDRFKHIISEIGYDKWLNDFQSPQEWEKRVRFIQECEEELLNLIELNFIQK
ncbi:MAG: hypothetical protein GF317_14860 [Candidatus Lokiarchaeota archaeon]|nr:hypothetical protein [Candidatus Lokiarchaeota archaeon]MBD3200883.1 hypothetical protein [Candidatus Lokiarchaeota archaeon]